jgi:hypothetical protein
VHILADGSVVSCEVRDHVELGRIGCGATGPTLNDIWNGASYVALRDQFRAGTVAECQECPYKTAYFPESLASVIDATEGAHAQLLYGWHAPDGTGLLWSKRRAAIELAWPWGARRLRIKGWMPAQSGPNRVEIDGVMAESFGRRLARSHRIRVDLPLPKPGHPKITGVLGESRLPRSSSAASAPDRIRAWQ